MQPDFVLDPTDTGDLRLLRQCWNVRRLGDGIRDDYLLVRVAPPFEGEKYGRRSDETIDHVLLCARHRGHTLFPVTEWPEHVYVATVDSGVLAGATSFQTEQATLITWGIIYPTEDQARTLLGHWPTRST